MIERARIDDAVSRQVKQEIAELAELLRRQGPGDQRAVHERRSAVASLPVPQRAERRGTPRGLARQRPPSRLKVEGELARAPAFLAAVRRLLDTGGTERITSDGQEHLFTVLPVRNRQTSGALVVSINLDEVHQELNTTMRTYTIVAALSLGLITALALWQSGRLLAPFRELRDRREIRETDLSQRIPVAGNDDLTALTGTFNDMLDRLEASFTTQREFLDDAGHELRTPITVLRGHLELLDGQPRRRRGDPGAAPGEVDRMARLVNDLILLAKSRSPRFPRPGGPQSGAAHETVLAKARGSVSVSGNRTGPAAARSPSTSSVSPRPCLRSPTTP